MRHVRAEPSSTSIVIQKSHRFPDTVEGNLVELRGFEPLTSAVRLRRSPI